MPNVVPTQEPSIVVANPDVLDELSSAIEVDARGTFFPAALVELVRVVRERSPGDEVVFLVTDPAAHQEIPAWALRQAHQVLAIESLTDVTASPSTYIRITVRLGARD